MAMGGLDAALSTAANYRVFAEEARGRSAAYEALATLVAGDDTILRFLGTLPPAKRQPNLLFAAARYLLGTPPDIAALRALVGQDRAGLARVMLARRTQTNEPARCATLLPALAQLPPPLALIEVGASAGLTLLFDRYSYDYGGHLIPGSDPDAPTLRCVPRGPVPLPERLPVIAWRAGLDLNPLDVTDDDDVHWLSCLVWPGEGDREARLAATPRRSTAVTCSRTCPRWQPRLRPGRHWSSFTRRCWPMSRRRAGGGSAAPSAACRPSGCPARHPASCPASRSRPAKVGRSC